LENRTAAFHNLGCKVNAYELEGMEESLRRAGYRIVPFTERADVYVINTCTVTRVADQKSRQMISRAKTLNPDAIVVACGCYANTGKDVLIRDGVADLILGNNEKSHLNEEIEKLQEDLEKSESETKEYISLSQRLQADFENFKKIQDKRNKDLVKFANENVILNFLDCYEDFGRALETENDEDLRKGIELIYNKFSDILEKEGVSEIPAKGEKFDLNKHEALMVQESDDVENGYVIEELMKGYMYKDKVLKYSKVIVCKK